MDNATYRLTERIRFGCITIAAHFVSLTWSTVITEDDKYRLFWYGTRTRWSASTKRGRRFARWRPERPYLFSSEAKLLIRHATTLLGSDGEKQTEVKCRITKPVIHCSLYIKHLRQKQRENKIRCRVHRIYVRITLHPLYVWWFVQATALLRQNDRTCFQYMNEWIIHGTTVYTPIKF